MIKENDFLKWASSDCDSEKKELECAFINILGGEGKCEFGSLGEFSFINGAVSFNASPKLIEALSIMTKIEDSDWTMVPDETPYRQALMVTDSGDGWRNMGDLTHEIIVLSVENNRIVPHGEEVELDEDGNLYVYQCFSDKKTSLPTFVLERMPYSLRTPLTTGNGFLKRRPKICSGQSFRMTNKTPLKSLEKPKKT